jgi:TRAP-type mannitol/chloroaromatic compound transport system permease large subunit
MGANALSAGTASLILFGVFFGLMGLRVPVAFALGLACLPIMLVEPHLSPVTMIGETFNAFNSFILLAVPLFLLTANLMNVGGITDRLMRLSRALVGHFPGGLAQINVVLSIFFAGISARRPPTRRASPSSSSRRSAGRATTTASRSRSRRSRRSWP